MSANSFGNIFKISSFGESHGVGLGVLIDGCPAGVVWSDEILLHALERRKPGSSSLVTARAEQDKPEILSGVYEGRTLGTPICIVVRNHDARMQDYEKIKSSPRTGHADDMWKDKFGHSDHRGGGRSSGRETLARVLGGAVAEMFLKQSVPSIKIFSYPKSIGKIEIDPSDVEPGAKYNLSSKKYSEVESYLLNLKEGGDSVGGVVEVIAHGAPRGLGQPVFNKLKSDLAAAYMSVGATTGVELGGGFSLAKLHGTEVHQKNSIDQGNANDNYGGIRGGISTGEPIVMRVAFKPTSSILDVAKKGRHDPCIVLRALPVIEAMTSLVIADHVLWSRLDRV